MIKDVVVTITRQTQALTQEGFGMPLILATNVDKDYKEYTTIAAVKADYAESTEAYKMAAAILNQPTNVPKIAIFGVLYDAETQAPAILTAALDELILSKNDWYFLLCQEQADEEITALSTWIDTQKKLYFAATSNELLPVTLESENTVIFVHSVPGKYPDCAWVGRCAPENPGSITWKFKTLTGIDPEEISAPDLDEIHASGGNTYVEKYGVKQTSEGLTTSGEYIDIIRGQHFIEARMAEKVSRTLFAQPKVPYTNAGIALIVADVESVLKLATTNGIIATDTDGNALYTVNAPTRQGADPNDVAKRALKGLTWTAIIAGGIHTVEIHGTLTL